MAVLIVGTLDTKGAEIEFARDVLEDAGVETHIVDVGVMAPPEIEPDTPADRVAALADTSLASLRETEDRGTAIAAMGTGAARRALELHDRDEVEGILGLGGSGNTSIATEAMRALPYGVPKLMVSTMASGDVGDYVGASDIMMYHSVADVEGLNQLTRRIITNAARAMAGMVGPDGAVQRSNRPSIGVTMFGVTTPCVQRAREYLEAEGYEVIVFHATGTGGRAMESLVAEGVIDGVLDVTTTEWADELVGGELAAGADRLLAPGERAIPHVVSVGALDMVNFGPREEVPERFEGRTFHEHNPQVTLMRTTPEETAELGRILAGQLNAGTGPRAVFLPLEGVSMLDQPGEPFYDPEADAALFESIRATLDDDVELVELSAAINDEEFALAMARRLDELMRETGAGPKL